VEVGVVEAVASVEVVLVLVVSVLPVSAVESAAGAPVVSVEDVLVVSEVVASAEPDPVVESRLASALALKMPTAAATASPRTALAVRFLSFPATIVILPVRSWEGRAKNSRSGR
jgi:hypothetical protein